MKILTIFFLFFSFPFFSQNVSVNLHQISKNKNVTLDSIYSKHLEQYRSFYVYLPKNYSRDTKYPVIYATDGQSLSDSLYFNIIDSLIDNNMVKPFIIIGVFSNEQKVENDFLEYRNYEYLESWSNSKLIDNKHLYKSHFKFFTEELISHIEEKYSVSKKFEERFMYGFSNGAAFCLSLSLKKPELFGSYILPSLVGGDYFINEYLQKKETPKLLSKYYFSYGTKEPFNEIDIIKKFVKQKQINCTISKFKGEHERTKWAGEFLNYMKNNLK
jgi:enterochelin esterase-like enzyme